MNGLFKNIRLLLMCGVLTGCVAFRGKQLPQIPAPEKAKNPSAGLLIIDAKITRSGKPIPDRFRVAVDLQKQISSDIAMNTGFFRLVVTTSPIGGIHEGDFTLQLHLDNWGNDVAAALSGFVGGLTLSVIPAFATDHYTLDAKLLDHMGGQRWAKEYQDKLISVIWLPMIPLMFSENHGFFSVFHETLINMYRHVFMDIQKEVFDSSSR